MECEVTVKMSMSGEDATQIREAIRWLAGLHFVDGDGVISRLQIRDTSHGRVLVRLYGKLAGLPNAGE